MAVRVDKAVRVHEAQIFRLVVGRTARGERLGNEAIYFIATLALKVEQDFDSLARVADGFGRELLKPGVRGQHHGNRVADDDAPASLIAELRVP